MQYKNLSSDQQKLADIEIEKKRNEFKFFKTYEEAVMFLSSISQAFVDPDHNKVFSYYDHNRAVTVFREVLPVTISLDDTSCIEGWMIKQSEKSWM